MRVQIQSPFSDQWCRRFLSLAQQISLWSKDPSTKVGTIFVDKDKNILSTGFNGFPRKVDDDPDRYYDRKVKYKMVVHAEANAVAAAARNGHSLKGAICFTTAFPCSTCSGIVINAGATQIYYLEKTSYEERWKEDLDISRLMLDEAEISYQQLA